MRRCGSCNICCRITEVRSGIVDSPAGELCMFYKKGCTLYRKAIRPLICRKYYCGWARGLGDIFDRPDESNVMLSVSEFNGGTWIFVQEIKRNAYRTTGKNIIIDAIKKVGLPVIVSAFDTKFGEDYGDYVILSEKMEKRAGKIKGEYLTGLSDGINVYKLIADGCSV